MNTNNVTQGLGRLVLGLILLAAWIAPQEAEAKKYQGVSFQVFYDELSPYGDWVKDARYGYIWLPAVREDFHPYGTEGHWVMTEYGNTWVSYYDWGWAPFHYGRWYFDDYFQSWAWIPGYEWGPAWVNWRTGGGYYGWAPLGPGVSINVRVNIPSFHWVFIPNHHIYHHYAYRYHAPHKTKIKIYNQTTIINNTVVYNNQTYVGGPQRREVERVTRSVVPVYKLQASNAPGRAAVSRNSVSMYRPEIQESRSRSMEARPSRVLDAQQAKTGRSNREVYSSSPSRSAQGNPEISGRTGNSENRSVSPSPRGEAEKFEMKPAPADTKGTGTSTAPSLSQSSGNPEAAPSRTYESRPSGSSSRGNAPSRSGGEVRQEGTRTQSSAPSRGTVQQSRPTQAPARTSAPEVRRSEPERVSTPSRSESGRSSSQVKSSAPAKNGNSANTRTSETNSGRGGSRDRNN